MPLFSMYLKDASGIIFVYDVGNDESLRNVEDKWAPLVIKVL